MKRKEGRTTESIMEAVNKSLEREMKLRSRMMEELRKGTPLGLKWAERRGLTHWHAVGFGCSPKCLKGVGEQLDHDFGDQKNFIIYKSKSKGRSK